MNFSWILFYEIGIIIIIIIIITIIITIITTIITTIVIVIIRKTIFLVSLSTCHSCTHCAVAHILLYRLQRARVPQNLG